MLWFGTARAGCRAGFTLDLDWWSLLHEDGHQEGVAVGYTRHELKPCHRPLIAALAEAKMVAGYWLRRADSACANGAAEFLRQTVQGMPSQIRIGLLRRGCGFRPCQCAGRGGSVGAEVHPGGTADAGCQ